MKLHDGDTVATILILLNPLIWPFVLWGCLLLLLDEIRYRRKAKADEQYLRRHDAPSPYSVDRGRRGH